MSGRIGFQTVSLFAIASTIAYETDRKETEKLEKKRAREVLNYSLYVVLTFRNEQSAGESRR